MQISSSTAAFSPSVPEIPDRDVVVLPNDITTQSKQRAENELPVQLRSLAERVHLNMQTAYRLYHQEETRAFQASEQIINSITVELDAQDSDVQSLPIKLQQNAILLSNLVSNAPGDYGRFVKVFDSLREGEDQLTQGIDSKIDELGLSLDEESSRLLGNIERITKATERRAESISARINELRDERYRLYSLSSTRAIDAKIKELDGAISILIEERNKAYETRRKEIEEEENKSHKLAEKLRTERRSLDSFKSYWWEYLATQREKIFNWTQNNWVQRRLTQISEVIRRLLQLHLSRILTTGTTARTSDVTGSGTIQPFHYARQGVNLAIANASVAAIPVSMGAKVVGAAAEKVGLTSVANYFNNQAKNLLRGVTENWSAANEGPLGRAFDTQVHAITSPLEPFIGHNQQFLAGWITGNLPARIVYAPDSIQVRDMAESLNVKRAIDKFYAAGAPKLTTFWHDTFDAYWETMVNPFTANWKSTAMQVGGYDDATITNNDNGTMTIRIRNVAGANSFFYHLLPNLPGKSGPMHNVEQVFEWTVPIDSTRLPQTNQ